jgi:hypothetical protein
LISAAIAALALAPGVTLSQDNAPAAPASDAATGTTGTVVFFREKKMMGAAISYKVRENGVELCKLGSGSFCTVQVPAGKHAYVTKTEATDVLNMEVEPGQTCYVQASISMGVVAGHSNLAPSTQEVFDGNKTKHKDHPGKDLDPPMK